jgi:hypothetical protein
VRELLKKNYRCDAFNIGINDGPAAGQTVPHAHIHVILRKKGDVEDPRGGVRWIIPAKAKCWCASLSLPEEQVKFLVNLQRLLEEGQFVWTYKYALLLALADLSVEHGNDTDEPLEISTRSIAEKFIQYYWR